MPSHPSPHHRAQQQPQLPINEVLYSNSRACRTLCTGQSITMAETAILTCSLLTQKSAAEPPKF